MFVVIGVETRVEIGFDSLFSNWSLRHRTVSSVFIINVFLSESLV